MFNIKVGGKNFKVSGNYAWLVVATIFFLLIISAIGITQIGRDLFELPWTTLFAVIFLTLEIKINNSVYTIIPWPIIRKYTSGSIMYSGLIYFIINLFK